VSVSGGLPLVYEGCMSARILLLAFFLTTGFGLLSPGAWAQGQNPGAIGTPGFKPGMGAKPSKGPRDVAPPALPGSRAEPTAVAPADRVTADLPPTEALFDSINRGDLPGARDAVSRGADLQGINVLGLTPLDLAVDLGRNEISFLLLSLRGGSGFSTTGAPAEPKPPTRADRAALARAERAQRTAVAARPSAGNAPMAPRLFAGDGGTAVPQAGFLGFDAAR